MLQSFLGPNTFAAYFLHFLFLTRTMQIPNGLADLDDMNSTRNLHVEGSYQPSVIEPYRF